MRVDKYLWAIRLFKSRNAASTACKKGYVQIAGLNIKPSREVYVSDKIVLRRNQFTMELLVLDLPKNRVGAKLVAQYCKDITPEEVLEQRHSVEENQRLSRVKGTGRPSKKDRRDLDDFFDDHP